MKSDLIATRQALLDGRKQPLEVAQACLDVAQSDACQHAFRLITADNLINT
ncbi:MAG: hypothetical protein RLZZ329_1568, partial [Pseudomonadota bacterium]